MLRNVLLPLSLLLAALLLSAFVAYGTHPVWAEIPNGLRVILLARRLEWLVLAAAIVPSLVLVGVVVAGRRRAWWLLGLGPVLALLVHRYQTDPLRELQILDNPAFLPAAEAGFLGPDDYVVGVVFNDVPYAYPYSVLYRSPVIFQSDHDQRMILLWSAYANRALARRITRELRAADLEIVSMPANALLLYNRKLGQFINGLTGQTPSGGVPSGFSSSIALRKQRWIDWRQSYPGTRVLAPLAGMDLSRQPKGPIRPRLRSAVMPDGVSAELPIVFVDGPEPVAILPQIVSEQPLNLSTKCGPLLILRDPASTQVLAFDRRVEDLTLRFRASNDPRRRGVLMVDEDTRSGWSGSGRAVDGVFAEKKHRLKPVDVDEALFWGVMKLWYPKAELITAPGAG